MIRFHDLIFFGCSSTFAMDWVRCNFSNLSGTCFSCVGAARVAALAKQIPILDSVFTLETLATRRAVLFVQELGLRNVVFEGDSESSIQAISNRLLSHSSCGHIIHDILLFASSFQSFSFSYVCRQGNALADALAKRVKLSCPLLVWMDFIPPNLYNC